MTRRKVRISIVTAVRNGRDTIADALDSALAQSWPDVEHIVVDGASSDGTREILARYRDRLAVVVSERDDGLYDALNKGIRLATGDVVGFLHCDDLFATDHALELIAEQFEDPAVDAAYGDLAYVRASDPTRIVRLWRAGPFSRRQLARGWMPPHPTFYASRVLYDRLGGFDTRYRIAADYDCVLRLLGAGGIEPRYVPHVLVKMRVGGMSNRSLGNIVQKSREDYRAARANEVGAVGTLLWKNFRKLPQFVVRS